MYSCENHAGRLIELRLEPPVSEEEVDELTQRYVDLVRSIPRRYVSITDLRRAYVFPPAVAERLIALMKQTSPRTERSALLIADSAVLGLQAERALDEGGHENRRAFRRADELRAWLGEVLEAFEMERLDRFLGERG